MITTKVAKRNYMTNKTLVFSQLFTEGTREETHVGNVPCDGNKVRFIASLRY